MTKKVGNGLKPFHSLEFVSRPNSCHGCPLAKIVPKWAKIGNICGSILTRYEVDYSLDDLGRTICTVRECGEPTA